MNDFDSFVDDLQNRIFDEAKQAYGDKGFDRWRNPMYNHRMTDPDGYARVKGSCGDTMEMYIKFENNRVKEASYMTDGCASSSICGSFAAQIAIGKTPDELVDISGESVIDVIGKLPDEDQHCAALAAEAVKEALNDYMSGKRSA